jgi:Glycosyl transferase family 8
LPGAPTFFTVSDEHFFVGTVCLVNSLRLTGHDGEIVVLDLGLASEQRTRLAVTATLVDPLPEHGRPPGIFKPFPALLDHSGTLVFLDSDVIVTRSLDPLVERAAAGEVVMCSDIEPQRNRWFGEWEELFNLPAAPRRQPYLNAGLVAFSRDRRPGLLERWWEASHAIPVERTMPAGARSTDPFAFGDQDVMNALLMTVVPRERVVGLPEEECPSPELLPRVKVLDERRLACRLRDRSPYLLHYWGGPKPWHPRAWARVRRDAYVRLIPRLLYDVDAPVPVAPGEVPRWLRPGRLDRLQLRLLGAANAFVRVFLNRLSHDSRNRLARVRKRLGR